MASVRCSRCKRPLRSGRRIGRVCAARERADRKREALENALRIATAPFSDRQIADASALIAAGKYKRLSKGGLWAVDSSDGVTVYRCCALYCPCFAKGPCKHMCLVALIETYEAFQEVA